MSRIEIPPSPSWFSQFLTTISSSIEISEDCVPTPETEGEWNRNRAEWHSARHPCQPQVFLSFGELMALRDTLWIWSYSTYGQECFSKASAPKRMGSQDSSYHTREIRSPKSRSKETRWKGAVFPSALLNSMTRLLGQSPQWPVAAGKLVLSRLRSKPKPAK